MLIGELSKRSGFSRDTIRYYEKIELIVVSKSARREHNYKDYSEEVLEQLKAIKKYKELGFTLEEIRELLVRQSIQVLDVAKVLDVIDIKISSVNEELEKLHALKMRLNRERELLGRKKTGHVIQLPEMKQAV
ncbi:MAG: MerR family transcriptional regulator [Flavipsychrobacter sp.]